MLIEAMMLPPCACASVCSAWSFSEMLELCLPSFLNLRRWSVVETAIHGRVAMYKTTAIPLVPCDPSSVWKDDDMFLLLPSTKVDFVTRFAHKIRVEIKKLSLLRRRRNQTREREAKERTFM